MWQNPQQDTTLLPPLTNNQLMKETQAIVLQLPVKDAAEQQGSTPRAVEAQRNGESCPSLRAIVNMARANPRARAMVARLIGVPGQCSDPDFMEGLEKVVEFYVRQHAPADGPAQIEGEATGDLFAGKIG